MFEGYSPAGITLKIFQSNFKMEAMDPPATHEKSVWSKESVNFLVEKQGK